MQPQVILGFSGGLDTTFCVKWLQEHGYEPICVTIDIGQEDNLSVVQQRAAALGVHTIRIVDGIQDFVNYFIVPALKANALYQAVYPLATALSRPLIGKVLAEAAQEFGTPYIAHGCTGKGNDQIRLELAIKALLPEAIIIDPVRDENLSRDAEMAYLAERNIHLGITPNKSYSIDQNIWGRSICSGVLEDIWIEPPEEVFAWTSSLDKCPDVPEYVEIGFEAGVPVTCDGQTVSMLELIRHVNALGGIHGIGRIDHIEDRVVGIKSHEIYEAPAASILITAHQALETITLTGSTLKFKKALEAEYARLIYQGGWFTHHHMDLVAYLQHNQRPVTGSIRLKLYKGHCLPVGRAAAHSLYHPELVTYSARSIYDQTAGAGFIKIFGLEQTVEAQAQQLNFGAETRMLAGQEETC
jgi:argininosuccinate synthase